MTVLKKVSLVDALQATCFYGAKAYVLSPIEEGTSIDELCHAYECLIEADEDVASKFEKLK